MSFRLQVAGKEQVFSANFSEAAEWGSTKLALTEKVGPVINVRLEILDLVASVNMPDTWPPGLSALLRVPDATQTASREVRKLAAMLQTVSKDVSRTEARIAQVSQRTFSIRAAMGITEDDVVSSKPSTEVGHFRPVLNQWVSRRVDDKRLQALSQPKRELEEGSPQYFNLPSSPERGVDEARLRTLAQPKRFFSEEGAVGPRPGSERRREKAEEAKPSSAVSMPAMRRTPRADVDTAKSVRLQC
jgi:hypothetical protein